MHRVAAGEDAREIRRDDGGPFVQRIRFGRLSNTHPSVGDQNVQPAKRLDGFTDHAGDLPSIGDVRLESDGADSKGTELVNRTLGLFGIASRYSDMGAGLRQTSSNPQPNPAIAPRDDRHLAAQIKKLHSCR
jgi:hypothetical protein